MQKKSIFKHTGNGVKSCFLFDKTMILLSYHSFLVTLTNRLLALSISFVFCSKKKKKLGIKMGIWNVLTKIICARMQKLY